MIHLIKQHCFFICRELSETNFSDDEKLRTEIKGLKYSDQCFSFNGIPIDLPPHYTLGHVQNNIKSQASNSNANSNQEQIALPLISR